MQIESLIYNIMAARIIQNSYGSFDRLGPRTMPPAELNKY